MRKANDSTDEAANKQVDEKKSADVSPLDRDDFLAANRRNREQIREEVAAKQAKQAKRGGVENPAADSADDEAVGDEAAGEVGVDPSRIPGKVAPTKREPGRRMVIVLAALAAVFAMLAGVFGYLYATDDSGGGLGPDSGIGREALDAAKKYTVTIVSYSPGEYSQLDRKIRAISTTEFADRYIASSQDARKGNDEAKATSTGNAVDAGLISITDERAVVLVALDQKVTSPDASAADRGVDYQSRVKLTLQRDGDRWVVSDLSTI